MSRMFCCSCPSSGTMDLSKVSDDPLTDGRGEEADQRAGIGDEEEAGEAMGKSYKKLRNSYIDDRDDGGRRGSDASGPRDPSDPSSPLPKPRTKVKSGHNDEKEKRQTQPKEVISSKDKKGKSQKKDKAKKRGREERDKDRGADRCKVKLIGEDHQDDGREGSGGADETESHREDVEGLIEMRYMRPLGLPPPPPTPPPPPSLEHLESGAAKSRKKSPHYELDCNSYSTKKNIAHGMLDIALLTANATQLKYMLNRRIGPLKGLEARKGPSKGLEAMDGTSEIDSFMSFDYIHYVYWGTLFAIFVSIFLQVIVGILLLLNSRHNITRSRDRSRAECCNNVISLGAFFITIINVFISVFMGYDIEGDSH